MEGTSQLCSGSHSSALCKRCKAKVANPVKCLNCDNVFHLRCAKKMSNVVVINENISVCCEESSDSNNDNDIVCDIMKEFADSNCKIDIKLVKYIIQQKDFMIGMLKDKVNILTKHIDLLNKSQIYSASKKDLHNVVDDRNSSAQSSPQVISIPTVNVEVSDNSINSLSDSSKLLNASDRLISTTSVNTVHHMSQPQVYNQPEAGAIKHKRRNPLTVVGRKVNSDNSMKLKGVSKVVSLHVYRLDPETKSDDLIEFLKSDFPVMSCEKLNSRYPDLYASFKIDITEDCLQTALNPEIWPMNACIRRFFQPRQKLGNG